MSPCRECGTELAPNQQVCHSCGKPVVNASGRTAHKTMLGIPSAVPSGPAPGADPAQATAVPNLNATVTAGTPAVHSANVAQPVPTGVGKKTMIGMVSPINPGTFGIPQSAPAPQQNVQVPAGPTARAADVPQPTGTSQAVGKKTMMGVAPAPSAYTASTESAVTSSAVATHSAPGFGSTQVIATSPFAQRSDANSASAQVADAAPGGVGPGSPEATALAGSGAQRPNFQKTVLGVARPGIAPINPGQQKSAPAAALPSVAEVDVPPPPELKVTKWRMPRGAVVLVAVCGLILAGVGAFAVFYESPKPLLASVSLDPQGKEALTLRCGSCPDGTVVSLAGASAKFSNSEALLVLVTPLRIGDNILDVTLDRPNMGRDEALQLKVPVQYRVRGDFTSLKAEKPEIGVLVEAAPGTTAVINKEAVLLDAAGTGRYGVDVSAKLAGPENATKSLNETISYSITPQEGEPQSGSISLQIGIAPLSIEAPGLRTVLETDRFMLAGKTAKGGSISVGGRPLTVDPTGRFEQMMTVDAVGETTITVRAEVPEHAPRLVPIKVKRVEDLKKEAILFRQTATDAYASYSQNIEDKVGLAVALEGSVEESRIENQTTIIVLEASSGCPKGPCLARLVYGARVKLRTRQKIAAFGRITRAVDGVRAGAKIPEVRVEFLLESPLR